MKAKIARYCDNRNRNKIKWDVVVYWTHAPERAPHDYDLYLSPKAWRELSGLRSPTKTEVMDVDISFRLRS